MSPASSTSWSAACGTGSVGPLLPGLLLLAIAGQAPSPSDGVVVLVGRRTNVDRARATSLGDDVGAVLASFGVNVLLDTREAEARLAQAGVKDSADCGGRRPCLGELGQRLHASHVVSLDLAVAAGELALYVEALRVPDGERLAKESLVVPVGLSAKSLERDLSRFAKDLPQVPKPLVEEAAPAPPPKPVLEPPPPPPAQIVAAPPPPAPLPAQGGSSAWIPTLGGVVVGAGAAFCFVESNDLHNRLTNPSVPAPGPTVGPQYRDQGKLWQGAGEVGIAVASAALVTGIAMYLLHR